MLGVNLMHKEQNAHLQFLFDSGSLRLGCHRRTMPGGGLPVVDPPLLDGVGAVDQFLTRRFAVFDDDHHAGVELSLRMIYVG